MNKKTIILPLLLIISGFVMGIVSPVLADPLYNIPYLGLFERELKPGEVFYIKNNNGEILSKMARIVHDGDELIGEDNKHYRVVKVKGNVAYAEYVGEHDITDYTASESFQLAENENRNNLIAVYHTHSDESYLPEDGTESEPARGGVLDVGSKFSKKLREKGINAIHSKESHEPHDSNSYKRSRRTAVELMRKAPAVIIDIHRDGIKDPDYYRDKISGVRATKIRLVVGRQNQNMRSNLEFAKKVKAKINNIYPGLVKEIFIAKGNYNQDLSPRALLLEVGTYTNSKERATNGAVLFADALPTILGITGAPGKGQPGTTENRSDWTTVLWMLIIAVVAGGLFLVLSTGSFKGAMDKLKQLTSSEWANFMGKFKMNRFRRKNTLESKINSDKFRIQEVSEAEKEQLEPEETNDERAEFQKD